MCKGTAIQTIASLKAGFKTHLTMGVHDLAGFLQGRRIRDSKNDPEGVRQDSPGRKPWEPRQVQLPTLKRWCRLLRSFWDGILCIHTRGLASRAVLLDPSGSERWWYLGRRMPAPPALAPWAFLLHPCGVELKRIPLSEPQASGGGRSASELFGVG